MINRRTVLKGFGVSLALPMLDAMGAPAAGTPRRMIAVETNQGIVPQFFFPKKTGRDYESTPYLDVLKDFRNQLTLFSGVSHPEVDGGHGAQQCFLTAAPHPGRGGFRNTISVDQFAAQQIGHRTRFPSLVLSIGTQGSISYTGAGVQIPGMDRPSDVFRSLFVQGSKEEVAAEVERLRRGRSILDSVADRAKALRDRAGAADREKLDGYFTGVRELEKRLAMNQEWEGKPKPRVAASVPKDPDRNAVIANMRAMFDLARLAIQTDSTRLVSVYCYQNNNQPDVEGVTSGTHALTHHGNRPEKLAQLRLIESAQLREVAALLGGLRDAKEEGGTLLDRTMVLYGTCMGNANNHSNVNLPVVIAGGGFRHAGHLAFDTERNYPLPNLFVSMLQRLGIETDRFASSTGTMKGLEPA